jgi:mono/diheme cytochrome c family protein
MLVSRLLDGCVARSTWLVVVGTCALLLAAVRPSAQQPAPAASTPSGNIEHGRYLVERVAMCYECHSTRDLQGNIVPGTKFNGGPMPMRPPWRSDWPLQIPRITGLPGYTDAEALRLLTQGAIKRDGTQLRYPMPRFRMTPQDAADVIAYLRSL